jgi:general secretion pathway protein N
MPVGRLALALFGLTLIFVVITAPARLLAFVLPAPQVLVQGLQGSVWSGRASSLAIAAPGGYIELGQTQWSLSPWSLLWLSPALEFESRWGRQSIEGHLSLPLLQSISLTDTAIAFDASLVKQWLPIQVDGMLSLQLESLELEDALLQSGSGRLVWQKARWYGSRGAQPLGDYVAEIEVTDVQQLQANLSTLAGPIEVNGKASLLGSSYTIDARLTSESPFHPELATPLGLMAAPIDNGFHLNFTSEL